ncbi:competence protein ComEC [Azonexus sp. IMCC34839]|uniref:competence protein ComEC n=1 Tax=Azonexus sp. IMCC34839 TaxID=3133695 RepID=UPI00399BCF56
MAEFVEIDFLAVETAKSGDAITIRYSDNETTTIHVVDGGFLDTGDKLVEHLKTRYQTTHVNHVVLTHTDQDHVNGLRKVLEQCSVGYLWMNRPWLYAEELIDRFSTYNSVDALRRRLRTVYEAAASLEALAQEKGIPICTPLQGAAIGNFEVLAPSKSRYLDLIVASEKTPSAVDEAKGLRLEELFAKALKSVVNLVKAAWAHEYFPSEGTSSENEMSVVQYANICGKNILLTGDAGRDGLREAASFALQAGIPLPGLWMFQVPHHGGRHNVDTEVLDTWLGERLASPSTSYLFNAMCSSAKADEHHPKNSVIRAIHHRGGHFASTEGQDICLSYGIERGWTPLPQWPYPEEHEED